MFASKQSRWFGNLRLSKFRATLLGVAATIVLSAAQGGGFAPESK